MDTKRFDYIDLLKTIAIYLVVLYHFNNIPFALYNENTPINYFNLYIKSFFSICVPLFFLVNGFLLLNRNSLNIKRHVFKIFKIIALVFIWNAITLLSLSLIRNEAIYPSEIFEIIWHIKNVASDELWWNNHFWFLIAIVFIYIFYPIIYTAYKSSDSKIFYFFFFSILILTFGNKFLGNIFTTIGFISNTFVNVNFERNLFGVFNPLYNIYYAYAFVYFMLGGILFKYRSYLNKRKIRLLAFAIIPLSMALLFLYTIVISLKTHSFWDIVWNGYDTIFTLINVVAVFIISLNYTCQGKIGKLISSIGKNSLGIYFVHIIIGNLLMPLFKHLELSKMLIFNLAFAFIILFLSLLLTELLRKIPFVNKLVSF